MFPLKPLECCFSSMLSAIVLLEDEPPSQSQISGRLKHVSLKNFPVYSAIHHSFNSDQFPSPCRWKTSPQHDAATTMLHCGDDALGVMRGVGFAPDIAFSLVAKNIEFSLIWPKYPFPYVWGVSHMPFGEHQTCLLDVFFKQLFCKSQLCGLKWSYGQIPQSTLQSLAAPSGLSLVSLLPLWLMPSLPGLWVLMGGPLLAGLLWCHILSIFK